MGLKKIPVPNEEHKRFPELVIFYYYMFSPLSAKFNKFHDQLIAISCFTKTFIY